MIRIRLVAALALVCALATVRPSAQAQKPTMEGYPALGAPPVVKLVSPGAAPRRAMRYAVPAGHKGSMTVTTSMEMVMSMMPMPMAFTMNLGLDVNVSSVAPNGDITYSLVFTKATVDGGADNPVAAAMQAGIGSIVGLKGTATVSNRGVTKSSKMDTDKIADPNLSQAMSQMTSTIEYLLVPLPEEAIGPGARWEARYGLETNGMVAFQRAEFELTSVTGSNAVITMKTEQTAPPQNMSAPGMPPEVQMSIERMASSGSGKVTQPFNALIPTMTADMVMTTSMNLNMGGGATAVTMDVKTKTSVTPGK